MQTKDTPDNPVPAPGPGEYTTSTAKMCVARKCTSAHGDFLEFALDPNMTAWSCSPESAYGIVRDAIRRVPRDLLIVEVKTSTVAKVSLLASECMPKS